MRLLSDKRWRAGEAALNAKDREIEQLQESLAGFEKLAKEGNNDIFVARARIAELEGKLADAATGRRVELTRKQSDREALSNIFAYAPGTPVWEAVHEVLDDAIVEKTNGLTGPQEVRAIDRGAAALEALMDFKAQLMEAVEVGAALRASLPADPPKGNE